MPGALRTITDEINAYSLKINPDGSIDVFLQDQTTPPVEYFLTNKTRDITIIDNVLLFSHRINVNLGDMDGITVNQGYYVTITYQDNDLVIPGTSEPLPEILRSRIYQGEVINILDQTTYLEVILDMPIDFAIDTTKILTAEVGDANAARASVLATIDNDIKMAITPPNGLNWDLTRLMVTGVMNDEPADDLFFDQPALVNGIYFGYENDVVGYYQYLANVKTNAGFRLSAYDVQFTTRSSPLTAYGLSVRKSFGGQDKYGVVTRLEGNQNARFVVGLQEDTSAITDYRFKALGHVVQGIPV